MKIVVAEPYIMSAEVKGTLTRLGAVTYGPFDTQTLADQLVDCDVLMVRLGHYIGEELFVRAPKLRFVVSATTGLDHIDMNAARSHGVRIISLRDCPASIQDVTATAEHCLGLLFALVRRTPAAVTHVHDGGWDRNLWGGQRNSRARRLVSL